MPTQEDNSSGLSMPLAIFTAATSLLWIVLTAFFLRAGWMAEAFRARRHVLWALAAVMLFVGIAGLVTAGIALVRRFRGRRDDI